MASKEKMVTCGLTSPTLENVYEKALIRSYLKIDTIAAIALMIAPKAGCMHPPQSLWYMRQFYLEYKDKPNLQQLVGEIPWSQNLLI